MAHSNINLTLKVWRQQSESSKGDFEEFKVSVSPHASILEMMDELNNKLDILEKKIDTKTNEEKTVSMQIKQDF